VIANAIKGGSVSVASKTEKPIGAKAKYLPLGPIIVRAIVVDSIKAIYNKKIVQTLHSRC
jgi:hypothetical protein